MDLKKEIAWRDERLDEFKAKHKKAMHVLTLLYNKRRQGFLEISEGNEAYDALEEIMLEQSITHD